LIVFDVDALMPAVGSDAPRRLVAAMQGDGAELEVFAMPADGATVVRQEDLNPISITGHDQWYFTSVDASTDLDGDGETDLLGDTERLTAWVAFGPFDQDRDVQEQGARLYMGDIAQGYGPLMLREVGDVTGDGWVDIAVPTGAGGIGVPDHGVVKLLPGPIDRDIDVSTAPLELEGTSEWVTGVSPVVSGGFDADGDGIQDFVVGQYPTVDQRLNRLLVYSGPILESRSSSDADAFLGQFAYNEAQPASLTFCDATGGYQESGGDMDGDGYEDLVVTNSCREVAGNVGAGIVWLVSGPITGTEDLDRVAVARILGKHKEDFLSTSLATRGDVDDDGSLDLVVGTCPYPSYKHPVEDPGMRLFFGPLQGTMYITDGVEVHARRSDKVRIDQDLDGDGISDMIMADAHMRRDDSDSYDNFIESGTHLWLSTRSMEWPRPWAPGNE